MTSRREFVLVGVGCSFSTLKTRVMRHWLAAWQVDSTRASAVAKLADLEPLRVPLLLLRTVHPPPGVDVYELNIGLADVFGKLRTKEAIPFLVKNITIDRTRAVNTWMKTPEVIEQRLAAVAALDRIGPDNFRRHYPGNLGTNDVRRSSRYCVRRRQDGRSASPGFPSLDP
jgi:hypothetical protein